MPRTRSEPTSNKERADGDRDSEGDESCDCADTEKRTDGDGAAEEEEGHEDADDAIEPDCVDRCFRDRVDLFPVPRKGKTVVTSVGESNPTSSYHAALAHGKGANDGDGEDGEGCVARHDLKEVGGPWLAEVGLKDLINVDDGVGCDELEEPTEEAADAGGQDDGTGRGDGCIGAFFGQVEGCVVPGHGPDDGDEGHEDRDTVGEVGADVEVAPDC